MTADKIQTWPDSGVTQESTGLVWISAENRQREHSTDTRLQLQFVCNHDSSNITVLHSQSFFVEINNNQVEDME